jgi:hypothetical protein
MEPGGKAGLLVEFENDETSCSHQVQQRSISIEVKVLLAGFIKGYLCRVPHIGICLDLANNNESNVWRIRQLRAKYGKGLILCHDSVTSFASSLRRMKKEK